MHDAEDSLHLDGIPFQVSRRAWRVVLDIHKLDVTICPGMQA